MTETIHFGMADDINIKRWWKQGMPLQQISLRLKRGKSTVRRRINQLGLQPRVNGGARHKSNTTLDSPFVMVEINCMCCKQPFDSWDRIKNRLCLACKSGSVSPFEPY